MKIGEEILHVNGVTKRFGGLVAVDDVSFSVREHEVMGIIGPNGSGKSTTMNMISGSLKVTSGSIVLEGHDLSRATAFANARFGVSRTFQLVRVLPRLSVVENAMAGAVFGHKQRWGREAEDYAREVLDRVGLGDKIAQPVSALTYIDQKRLELARALTGEPEVLLLDEWLAGLDPSELKIGIDLIASLRANGAGKSSLLRAIAGISEGAVSGSVMLGDMDLTKLKPGEIVEAGIAFVPEGRGIFGDLSVWENLLLAAYLGGA